MLPYGRQSIDQSDIDAVTAVLSGDWLTTGPQVTAFEADLAAVTGAACTVVSNGTAALHTAYAAAGIGPGDVVLMPPMTFVATAATAIARGATVRFCDIDPRTATIDPNAAAALVDDATRAVVCVDYAGHPGDYDRLREVTDAHDVTLVSDAAHAIGSLYKGRPVGSLADLTTFSFFPTKNLTTAEGGAVAALDASHHTRAQRFRTHGLIRDPRQLRDSDEGGWHQEVAELGLNYRLPDVLCALGRSQLSRLDSFKARRARLFERYGVGLAGLPGVGLPARHGDVDPLWHLYAIRVHDGRRREVYERMRAAGIGVQVNYLPVYWHPVFADAGYRRGLCPEAEAFYGEQLSLPLYADLGDADQDRVIETLWTILG
ncbi:DegT/DnrJ/EryC1/StrS family aminotransferase [Stackebrandtia soli]|uniref:DegT/DnrJ/EryC1/StrS family aminotransferase n=1 Tax=Stackebrandtia soli TaxID=1892856 RepID=UPI0039E98F5C